MDLKEIIAKVKNIAESAHSSYHAGRDGNAEEYLGKIRREITAYFEGPAKPAGDVTESATSEKPADEKKETPAEVPGAQVRPAGVLPEKLAQQAADLPESQKQTR